MWTGLPSASHAISVTSLTVSGVAPFWAIFEIHLYSVASVSTPRESWTSVKLAWTPTGSGFGLPWSSHTLNSWACRDMPGVPLWWNIPIESSPSAWIFQYLTGSVFCVSHFLLLSLLSTKDGCGLLGDFRAAAAAELAQAEDHELGRLHRRDADLADDLPGLDHVGRVGLGVALDEERLLRRACRTARPTATSGSGSSSTALRSCSHRNWSLGSNTLHCVPSMIDSAM